MAPDQNYLLRVVSNLGRWSIGEKEGGGRGQTTSQAPLSWEFTSWSSIKEKKKKEKERCFLLTILTLSLFIVL